MGRAARTVIALGIALTLGWATHAGSCTCVLGRFPVFMVVTGVRMPANARGVPCFNLTSREYVYVRHIGSGDKVPFKVESLALPEAYSAAGGGPERSAKISLICPEWKPGESYRIGIDALSVVVHVDRTSFEASDATIEEWKDTKGDLQTLTYGGSCSVTIRAHQVGVELFGETIDPWRGALLYFTVVDDALAWQPRPSLCSELPPGMSWVGNARELVYSECPADDEPLHGERTLRLDPGKHKVTMIAWLPGVIEVSAATNVELGCR
jgi:hypothetical protein